jgi:trehalose/maltose hydrolase-like predicted phosphorylase
MAIRAWDEEVQAHGGYRKYYADGKGGTTLQGGGTAGGIGIDFEFTESSMLAAVVPAGFMGLRPDGATLHIEPRLPAACPEMTVRNLLYQGIPLDITVSDDAVKIFARQKPPAHLPVEFRGQKTTIDDAGTFEIKAAAADAIKRP